MSGTVERKRQIMDSNTYKQRNGVRPYKEIAEGKRNVLYMCISNRYIRKN